MLLWFFFIVVSCLLGLSISFLLDIRFSALERAFFAIVLGHVVSIWLVFLLAYLGGTISTGIILLCIVICALLSAMFLIATRKRFAANLFDFKLDVYTLTFFAFILLYLLFMNLYGVLSHDEAGNLYALHTVWADYPFHTSVITSFVYSDSFTFPPIYPQFLHTEMHYPFLMDFYSAILMKAGLGLRGAIIIPNILFQSALFGLFFFLAYRLTGLKKVGALAVVIFIFSGYPPDLQSVGIHFLNPMYAVIMPQRTAMLGMAISFAVYILLYEALFQKEESEGGIKSELMYKELFLAGTLIGLLPYIHAHSFMATAFVSVVLIFIVVLKDLLENRFDQKGTRKNLRMHDLKIFICVCTPLILLSLPQILCIRTGVSENFFVFFPGWTEQNSSLILGSDWSLFGAISSFAKSILLVLKLWVLNLGILFFLLPVGFLKSTRNVRTFYLPFLLFFVLANLVKFQPWYFDNYKLFLHWYALTVILVAVAIFWLCDSVREKGRSIGALVLVFLVISCTLFGFVAHARMMDMNYQMWSGEEIRVAEWVRDNTESNSVFLTGSAHNHPIPSLSGRRRVMGYEGWLWSHGINGTRINERKRDEIEMYKGSYTLIKEYSVDYVCVGPYERAFARDNHFVVNYSAFDDLALFDLKLNEVIEGESWRLYKVKTPSTPA